MHDVIVIGSGLGGLTCGAFLARAGMRVLVLEKHLRVGGYADAFRRRHFVYDCGIHSVPLAPGGIMHHLLRQLGVVDRIELIPMPSMFACRTPTLSVELPSATEDIDSYLRERFPDQVNALRRLAKDATYFRETIQQADFDFEQNFIERNRLFVEQYHNRPFQHYLESVLSNPQLRHVLRSMWPYVGMPSHRAATVFYFMMFTMHYLEGSYGCRGGFCTLARALADVITECGGTVLTRKEVIALDIEKGHVVAVRCADGTIHEARIFVSNISPYLLHGKLIPERWRNRLWLRRLSHLRPSLSCVGVYLGVTPQIVSLLPSCVTIWFSTDDYESVYQKAISGPPTDIDHIVFLRSAEPSENPTLLLMRLCTADIAKDWHTEKMKVAERVLERAELLIPGLRNEIRHMEVGSPNTYERYTGNTGGALYGFENTCSLYGEARMPIRTHLTNLWQTGHWQRPGGGAWNVTVNGYTVANTILRSLK